MRIRGVIFEDFVNYKKPCMTIESPYCDFKCDKENGAQYCQNWALSQGEVVNISVDSLIEAYINNDITKAICFQGLEPFNTWEETYEFIYRLRQQYNCKDDVVIYTGYTEEELGGRMPQIKTLKNIVIKFGRYRPNEESHYDEILGVKLASSNQYAKRVC
jgi:hypothetical protein